VVIVAALRPEKNHELLLEALGLSVHQPLCHLAIVGQGARESAIQEYAEKLGMDDRLHWLGLRDDVPRILSVADLLVLCSHPVVETFPLCVLEGMAAELPVVSTRVGSIEEMMVEGKTGLLVPPSDVHALAGAIDELLHNPGRSRAMGKAGREHVLRNFDQETMVEATARLLRRVAAK
jgi:glycosyltransferase involved in cell wall biosynthesis